MEAASQQAVMGQVPTFQTAVQCLHSSLPPKKLGDCVPAGPGQGPMEGGDPPGTPSLKTASDLEGVP